MSRWFDNLFYLEQYVDVMHTTTVTLKKQTKTKQKQKQKTKTKNRTKQNKQKTVTTATTNTIWCKNVIGNLTLNTKPVKHVELISILTLGKTNVWLLFLLS